MRLKPKSHGHADGIWWHGPSRKGGGGEGKTLFNYYLFIPLLPICTLPGRAEWKKKEKRRKELTVLNSIDLSFAHSITLVRRSFPIAV